MNFKYIFYSNKSWSIYHYFYQQENQIKIKNIFKFLYLLVSSNSLILELKQILIPYLSLHENYSY